jgi:hypothetical protein
LKSELAKPVVVIIEVVLNTPCRTAEAPASVSALRSSTTTIADANKSTTAPTRTSSSRASRRGRLVTKTAYISAKFVPATSMKTVIVHCEAGANGSIERGSVENPAVASVANACAVALKRSIRGSTFVHPSTASAAISSAVKAT